MILNSPKGPVAPIICALAENEIFQGWVSSLEECSARQFVNLKVNPEIIESDGDHWISYHGLDDQTWALDHLFGEHFPALQRSAAFLTVWGSFELQMTRLCHEVAKAGGYRITIKDLEGKGVQRAKTYLLKVAEFDGDWVQVAWKDFPNFNSIRNIFAHKNGIVDSTNKELATFIASASNLMQSVEGTLRLGNAFLPHYLRQERRLLESLKRDIVTRFGNGT